MFLKRFCLICTGILGILFAASLSAEVKTTISPATIKDGLDFGDPIYAGTGELHFS